MLLGSVSGHDYSERFQDPGKTLRKDLTREGLTHENDRTLAY